MSNPTPDQWAKLGPLYVSRHHVDAAATTGHPQAVYPEALHSLADAGRASGAMMRARSSSVGTYPTSGLVDLDSNARLDPYTWRGYQTRVGIVDQMRLEDPVVAAIIKAWELPILRSGWTVNPAGDDRPALEQAEMVRANLFEYLRGGFHTFIEQAVSAVWRGFSLFEIVARFDRDSGAMRLDQLSPMLPRTVEEWRRDESGRWGVIQVPDVSDGASQPTMAGGVRLPADKLLHFVWDAAGDAPEGTSILRPCYAGWRTRRLYLKLEAAGFERGTTGIPYCEVAPTARAGDSAIVNEILRELRTGARAWASFPPGYTLKFADFPMKGADIREARIAAGRDMARAALTPFLTAGDTVGSYSLVRGQQDFFTMALQGAADMIGSVISHGPGSLIQRLVGWNYDTSEGFPTLTPGAISAEDPAEFVASIKTAAEAGALTTGPEVEEAVRTALGLPELPELETAEEMEARLKGGAITVTDPEAKAADTALNGAQVTAAMAIVQSVAVGELTHASAVGMLANFFSLPREVAEEILGGEPATTPEPEPPRPAPRAAPTVSEVTDDQADAIEDEAEAMEALAERLPGRLAVSGRDLRNEEQVVRLEETLAPMQGIKEAMAQAVQDWRESMAPKYAARMARAGDLLQMRSVDVPDLGALGETLRAELRRAYRAGQGSVREELDRLGANPELARAIRDGDFETTRDGIEVESPEVVTVLEQLPLDLDPKRLTGLTYLASLTDDRTLLLAPAKKRKVKAKKPTAPGESVSDEIDPEDAVENIARTTALAAGDRVKAASVTAVQSASVGGVLDAVATEAAVSGAVLALSPGADLVAAQRDTNTIFGLGRMQEARAEGSEEGIRSAMLESNTCEVCLSKDGARFPMEALDEFATPDPDCLGGDQCNCIVIFVPKES